MARLLLVDDTAALTELFAAAIREQLGHDVDTVSSIHDVGDALANAAAPYDLALVDLSFPNDDGSGLDALVELHNTSPGTVLAIVTQGDLYVARTLRDAYELLPIATVISKTVPLATQLETIRLVLRDGSTPIDPAIQPLVPSRGSSSRTAASFNRLVQHVGHAKLWSALLASPASATYREIAETAGLKLNTIKNYRAQLLGELAVHGLEDPGLAEMREFAQRCRPFLMPLVDDALRRTS